ncbi:MAG TPA: Lrp/AsnC family transcriptional regulator [Burkholderiaceae bacterium]|nr:Lrp/AsnC family transcriptional regulator [Burkholderiaceae bacterium]
MKQPIPLDEVDHRLLTLLQDDASLSNQALAEAAHVSPATALRRVRRLIEQGVIERQVAIVSPHAFESGLTAIVEVTLDRQSAERLAAFEARAVAEPAVQQCYRVSPGPDCVLVVWVRDMSHYNALVQRLFTEDANVRNVKSYFATRRAKFEPRIALTPPRPTPAPPTSAAPAP